MASTHSPTQEALEIEVKLRVWSGSIGIGLSILSYNGRVHFGLIADAKLVPDPRAVIQRFGTEFEKLLYLSLMGDWHQPLDSVAAEALLS